MVAIADRLKGRSFTRVADWSGDELLTALDLADEVVILNTGRVVFSGGANKLHLFHSNIFLLP